MSKPEKSERELLTEISEKLDKLTSILAIQGKDKVTQIRILKSVGYSSSQIGNVLGLSSLNVRKIISRNKIR